MINFSELLWKPGETPPARTSWATESVETAWRLPDIPIEEVAIDVASRIAVFSDPRSACADRFRFLRMRFRELKDLAKLRTVVITSPLPQDGKSTVALNLATALAEGGKRSVLVIEGDLYHPTLAERLGVPPRAGLAECIEGDLDPISALRRLRPLDWYFLQAGHPHGNPTELLQSDALVRVLETLSSRFDWILIDTPPIVPLTDAVSLSRHADASLLVVRAGQTTCGATERALALLGPKNVLGIIFNGAEGLNRLYSKYYGYYTKK